MYKVKNSQFKQSVNALIGAVKMIASTLDIDIVTLRIASNISSRKKLLSWKIHFPRYTVPMGSSYGRGGEGIAATMQ